MRVAYFCACVFVGVATSPQAFSQSSFADFEKADKVAGSEADQFKQVLNGEDSGRALRAMQFMIKSGNPDLVSAAKEFGLYSTNSVVQREAIAAILDSGGPFKLVADLSKIDDKKAKVGYYLTSIGGVYAVDQKSASFTFSVDPYSEEEGCWTFRNSSRCAFILSGTSVSLKGWSSGQGNLSLNDSGQLEGSVSYSNERNFSAPAIVNLID